jgi:hypothetical protein
MDLPPRLQQLRDLLGVVFVSTTSSYSPPSVVQVIGWTKNAEKGSAVRQPIIVQGVGMNNVHGPGGGQGTIDQANVVVPQYPIHHGGKQVTLGFTEYPILGTPILRKGRKGDRCGEYYTQVNDFTKVYHWCEY